MGSHEMDAKWGNLYRRRLSRTWDLPPEESRRAAEGAAQELWRWAWLYGWCAARWAAYPSIPKRIRTVLAVDGLTPERAMAMTDGRLLRTPGIGAASLPIIRTALAERPPIGEKP